MPTKRPSTRFRCVVCGKLTAGRLPRDGCEPGDTSVRFPRRHNVSGEPCPGNIQLAAWVTVDEDGVEYESPPELERGGW